MGTNYYARQGSCKTCGHSHHETHIGKSSCGWNFSLHVHPAINSLNDWVEFWSDETIQIFDECDKEISTAEMLNIITKRDHPRGLISHKVDGTHCIGNGEGTFDYIQGEFS